MVPRTVSNGNSTHTSRRIVSVRYVRRKSSWAFEINSPSTPAVQEAVERAQQASSMVRHGCSKRHNLIEYLYPDEIDPDADPTHGLIEWCEVELRGHIVDRLTPHTIQSTKRRLLPLSEPSRQGDLSGYEGDVDADEPHALGPYYVLSSPYRTTEETDFVTTLPDRSGRTYGFDLSMFDTTSLGSGWWQAFEDTKEKWSLSSNADVANFLPKTLATHPPKPAPGRAEA